MEKTESWIVKLWMSDFYFEYDFFLMEVLLPAVKCSFLLGAFCPVSSCVRDPAVVAMVED